MTPRARLEQERAALDALLTAQQEHLSQARSMPQWTERDRTFLPKYIAKVESTVAALTASIARLDVLLSLDNGSAQRIVTLLRHEARDCHEDDEVYNEDLHTVADLFLKIT